jgi:hypothetical protein
MMIQHQFVIFFLNEWILSFTQLKSIKIYQSPNKLKINHIALYILSQEIDFGNLKEGQSYATPLQGKMMMIHPPSL